MGMVSIPDRRLRALTFTAVGQSREQWLPGGVYDVLGACEVTTRHGSGQPAVELRDGTGASYYIGPNWFQEISTKV